MAGTGCFAQSVRVRVYGIFYIHYFCIFCMLWCIRIKQHSGTKTIPTNTNIVAMIRTTTDSDWLNSLHITKYVCSGEPHQSSIWLRYSFVYLLFTAWNFSGRWYYSEQIIRVTQHLQLLIMHVYGYNGAMSTLLLYTSYQCRFTTFHYSQKISRMPVQFLLHEFHSVPESCKDEVNIAFTALQDESIHRFVYSTWLVKQSRDEHMEVVEGFNKFNFDMTSFNQRNLLRWVD